LSEYLTTVNAAVWHPLGRPLEDVFFAGFTRELFQVEGRD
jgi:hypothetical protein